MKQYTEAERADIATECRRAICEAKSKDASYRTLARGAIAEIALASLETAPEAWAHRLVNKHSGTIHPWVYGSAEASPSEGDVFRIEVMKLYTAPPAPVVKVPDDYFSFLVSSARVRAEKAMKKFPQPNYVLNKVAEEHGEVVKAVIHYTEGRETWCNVEGELIDNLAMLIRLVREGDGKIGFTPPAEVLRLNDNSAPATDNTEEQYHSISREKGGVK